MKQSTIEKKKNKKDFGKEKIKILYEDAYLMVILKPSGILSSPYPGSRAKTVLDIVEHLMRKAGTYSPGHKPFIVHRLDRDTSGVMMLAMTETSQKKIMDSWHRMVTERLYRAVAENPLDGTRLPDNGLIDSPLAYNSHNIGFVPDSNSKPSEAALKIKRRSTDFPNSGREKSIYERHLEIKGGKAVFKTVPARTHYRVIERGCFHTLFELSLDTGKKNQIRAHLASLGYPLAGDENYRSKTDPFGRLALHARTLEFDHPFTGEHLKFEEPEPSEWIEFVKTKSSFNDVAIWSDKNSQYKRNKDCNRDLHTFDKYEKSVRIKPSRKKISAMDFIQRGKMGRC